MRDKPEQISIRVMMVFKKARDVFAPLWTLMQEQQSPPELFLVCSSSSSLLAIRVWWDLRKRCQMEEASLVLEKTSKPVNTSGPRWFEPWWLMTPNLPLCSNVSVSRSSGALNQNKYIQISQQALQMWGTVSFRLLLCYETFWLSGRM